MRKIDLLNASRTIAATRSVLELENCSFQLREFYVPITAQNQNQDDLADQLEHTGKGKNDAITKVFNAIGSVPAVKYHMEAAKYREVAARLRAELAQIENQSTASVPAP